MSMSKEERKQMRKRVARIEARRESRIPTAEENTVLNNWNFWFYQGVVISCLDDLDAKDKRIAELEAELNMFTMVKNP